MTNGVSHSSPNGDDLNLSGLPMAKPWKRKGIPRRVLAIRLQAMGDLVITLPYLQQLKRMLPDGAQLDLLTREEVEAIPRSIDLFDHVYAIGGGRNTKRQFFYAGLLLPQLLLRRYDMVIDLQNNIISSFVRKMLMVKSWSLFDRFAPIAAGERNRMAIEMAGLGKCFADTRFKIKNEQEAAGLLKANGWDGSSELVLLNPAGAFITRNWPTENYAEFARLWLNRFPQTQFLVIGISTIAEKAILLKQMHGVRLVNLVGKTNPAQAFAVIQHTRFALSEDSGLMHMAWVSGIPTLAIFGSTDGIRATPLGDHTMLLDSSDLECGNCMQETCKYGDVHCIKRYTPEFIFEKALTLTGQLFKSQAGS